MNSLKDNFVQLIQLTVEVDIWKSVEAAALSSSIHNKSTTTAIESTAAPVTSSSSEASSNTASSVINSTAVEPSTSSGAGFIRFIGSDIIGFIVVLTANLQK